MLRGALLLGLVLVAVSAAAVSIALFLALVLHTGASVSTGVAACAPAFRPDRTRHVDFNVG